MKNLNKKNLILVVAIQTLLLASKIWAASGGYFGQPLGGTWPWHPQFYLTTPVNIAPPTNIYDYVEVRGNTLNVIRIYGFRFSAWVNGVAANFPVEIDRRSSPDVCSSTSPVNIAVEDVTMTAWAGTPPVYFNAVTSSAGTLTDVLWRGVVVSTYPSYYKSFQQNPIVVRNGDYVYINMLGATSVYGGYNNAGSNIQLDVTEDPQ